MPKTRYFPSEPLSAEAEYKLSETEYAARQAVETTFNNERMQIEAMHCNLTEKIDTADTALAEGAQLLQQHLLLVTAMVAESERADNKNMSEDDEVIEKLGADFVKIASPTTSQSSLFQPAAAAASSAPAAQSWADWLLRR